jgi:hypothetical protein
MTAAIASVAPLIPMILRTVISSSGPGTPAAPPSARRPCLRYGVYSQRTGRPVHPGSAHAAALTTPRKRRGGVQAATASHVVASALTALPHTPAPGRAACLRRTGIGARPAPASARGCRISPAPRPSFRARHKMGRSKAFGKGSATDQSPRNGPLRAAADICDSLATRQQRRWRYRVPWWCRAS